ncbi:MAG: hypothetical protein LAN70_17950 [Acidobacteriia bacterium]|nr:hypothetical protein [Terriglobia bacterium]
MDTRAPIVIFLAVAILLLGYIVEVLLGKFRLRGYRQIAHDVRLLGAAIHGKADRDGEDVVLRGNAHSWPVSVRFSRSDLKPGLNIRMSIPSRITLYCIPRNQREVGRVPLHTADPRFDARFRISTDHPLEARIVFTSNVMSEVEKLCSSISTLLALENRTLELSELVLPEDRVYQHVLSRIEGMVKIADATAQMPGGAATKAGSGFARQWNWFRIAYVGIPILLILSLFVLAKTHKAPRAPAPQVLYPAGISGDEAAQIPDIQQWRLAQPADFEPGALSWMQQRGSRSTGRIPVSFTNSATGGVAYILKRIDGADGRSGRLVLFADGRLRFDLVLPELGIVAPIRLDAIESIQWTGRAPVGQADSDGILVVRRLEGPETATIFFFSGLHLLSGRPKDYQSLSAR